MRWVALAKLARKEEEEMISNRVLLLDDYLAMGRRHFKTILFLALVALVAGFLLSFAFSPKYTSTSQIQVEKPTALPSGIVKPFAPSYLQINFREIGERRERIRVLEQQILSRSHLQTMVERLGLAKKGRTVDAVIDEIQTNFSITEVDLSASFTPQSPSASAGSSTSSSTPLVPFSYSTPGFSVSFTTVNPHEAQQICAELTSDLLTENIKSREREVADTTEFLSRQVNEAKSNLDEQENKLALFKGQYLGQLPGDLEENLKILAGLDSQLEASTQALNRAQQDKAYTESVLAQQLAAWKSSQASVTSETIEQRLAALQTQLVAMQTRYTNDHPEVIKMKNDIAALEAMNKKMADSSDSSTESHVDEVVGKAEPPEILQLRQQVHQNEGIIERATAEQKQLREMIATYQGRLTRSPKVEEEYNQLTRDNANAHQVYEGLLSSKSESEIHEDMERHQEGEKLRLLNPASFPNSPSFPERWKFAGGGLAGGLTLGICIALWVELRDKAMRNEADVLAGVELPMLTAIPWVGAVSIEDGSPGRLKTLLGTR
jgi:uncharacterized protein involved in exopolysaccharide biosynthesis